MHVIVDTCGSAEVWALFGSFSLSALAQFTGSKDADGLCLADYYTPVLHENISSGFTIIICSVIAALIGVFALPIEEKAQEGAESE